jgi:hypothetical protein
MRNKTYVDPYICPVVSKKPRRTLTNPWSQAIDVFRVFALIFAHRARCAGAILLRPYDVEFDLFFRGNTLAGAVTTRPGRASSTQLPHWSELQKVKP